jgi:hypothetical protein
MASPERSAGTGFQVSLELYRAFLIGEFHRGDKPARDIPTPYAMTYPNCATRFGLRHLM